MKRIVTPTLGPDYWRTLLGDPAKHWKRGRSAFELAISWERAQRPPRGRGLPIEVAAVLDRVPELTEAELLIGMLEHKVALDTGNAPSQSDIWALLKNQRGLISLCIEGKAGESFDKQVRDWLTGSVDPS